MVSTRNHRTRRSILAGVTAVGVLGGSGFVTGSSMAWFMDVGSSRDNTVESGTIDLEFGSPSSLDLTKDLQPGSSVASSVELVNGGTRSGVLDVDVSYAGSGSADDVARALEVTALTYGTASQLGELSDHNGNGIVDLADFSNNDIATGEVTPNDLVDLSDPGPQGTTFAIELALQKGTNNLAGNSIDVSFTFHLNQTDAQ